MARYVPDVVRFNEAVDELDEAIVLDNVALPLELALTAEDPGIVELVLTPAVVESAGSELDTDALGDGVGALLIAVESTDVVAAGLLGDEPVPCRARRTLKSSIPPTGVCCIRGPSSSSQ